MGQRTCQPSTAEPAPSAARLSRLVAGGISRARDALARGLVGLGVQPNHLTLLGFLATLGTAWCLVRGASQQLPFLAVGSGPTGWWPLAGAGFLLLAGACDMLDGAVARLGNRKTPWGAILDSVLDRFSDMAIYVACAFHFARQGNLTYQLLSILALCNAVLVSYVKARAEEIIPDCTVGYWARGERFVAVLVGCLTGHMPAMLWQQAILPMFTVLRRLAFAYQAVRSQQSGRPPNRGPHPGWIGWLQPWRQPRGSTGHELVSIVNIGFVVFGPFFFPVLTAAGAWADPLARLLGR
jgi:CDP-diacylglycerol--glycerol-3-phosphate 3-phosphatidyltransferase